MTLQQLSILNFKNIAEAQLELSGNVNCFVGDNGMGKTNLLDAIYYLSFCKSCSGLADSGLLMHGADFMLVQGRYDRRGQEENISIGYRPGRRKAVKRGGKEYQRLSQHIGLLPLVMLSPADWGMITASEERRRFIDQIISQADSEYMAQLMRYLKALENRNSMLRHEVTDPLLFEGIEQQMTASAAYIHQARKAWVGEFSPLFLDYYRRISGGAEEVSLTYRSHLNAEPSMQQVLDRRRERDAILGYTSAGIHRDDIELMLGQQPIKQIGSQGQCKTYVAAMRLAQYDFLRRNCGFAPILLLDDIFDKLDAHRVESIIAVVGSDTFGQIFITDTNRTHLDHIIRRTGGRYRTWSVSHGAFTLVEEGEQ